MRVLVTGSAGFVGGHLVAALRGDGHDVAEYDLRYGDDIRDFEKLRGCIEENEPERIYHLAAETWPGESLIDPRRCMDVNAIGTLHLLQAVRVTGNDARILLAGTSEEYGYEGWARGEVITEDSPARPATPYGVSKLAATTMGLVYARRWGLPVAVTRAFNHSGWGRQAVNAESAFARRIVAVERCETDVIRHGSLAAKRNYTDVGDVVNAYRIAIEQPTGIYNVASPAGTVTLGQVMDTLLDLSVLTADQWRLEQDPRYGSGQSDPGEFPAVDTGKLTAAGWEPVIPLHATLSSVLEYWRTR